MEAMGHDVARNAGRRGGGTFGDTPALTRAAAAAPAEQVVRAAMWASLVPLALLLRPYGGLVQDARLYLGRGVADRDPAGVARDLVFSNDGQNGFSVMARGVDALLGVLSPVAASALLAGLGLAAWAAAATALALRIERGRAAWAIVVGLLALPGVYGGFNTFSYAEAVATPRVFAEAAVLGALAALLGGRTWLGLGLGLAAAALHPIMAAPGIAVAAVLLVRGDRRWALPVGAVAAGVAAAALFGAPLAGRLVAPIDPAWAAVLRMRSVNLFPSLWSFAAYATVARRLATALIAASLLAGASRALLLACSAVALAGLAAAAALGDRWMMELVTQMQPWRSLWLLAVAANAGLVLAVPRLWRGSDLDRLTLASLLAAWLLGDFAVPEVAAASAALGLRAAAFGGFSPRVPRRALAVAATGVACLALYGVAQSAMVAAVLLGAAWAQGGEATWALAAKADLLVIPVAAVALASACAPPPALTRRLESSAAAMGAPGRGRRRGTVAWIAAAGVSAGCALGLAAWDGSPAEADAPRDRAAAAALRDAIGPSPGEVMWVDEDSESWFLAGRPAFFNSMQGAPILFSRALALDWADRAALALRLGWARGIDVTPWTAPERRLDPVVLRPEALRRFCADPRRPAAVVAPGSQIAAAPPGWTARLWRPAAPFRRMWVDAGAIRWARWDAFTVIRCPGAAGPVAPAADHPASPGDRPGDARSLG